MKHPIQIEDISFLDIDRDTRFKRSAEPWGRGGWGGGGGGGWGGGRGGGYGGHGGGGGWGGWGRKRRSTNEIGNIGIDSFALEENPSTTRSKRSAEP